MSRSSSEKLLTVIRTAARGRRDEAVSDAELLACYSSQRDEAAFASLVRRHASMVLGVARRVLSQEQDAEDVCQTTFLLLARKGCRLKRQSVGGWLCATARLIALNARKAKARRARASDRAAYRPVGCVPPTALEWMTASELVSALDEELARLPDRYRGPLVLCCLEGLARDEAARRLGVPLGTLRIQLERGRARLRAGLDKRRLELGAALVAVVAGPVVATAKPEFVERMLAVARGADVPPAVATLSNGMWAMTRSKLAVAVVLASSVAAAVAVAAVSKSSPPAQATLEEALTPAALAFSVGTEPTGKSRPEPEQGRLQGRFTAADTGTPVAGAMVRVLIQGMPKARVVEASSDADGRYVLKLPFGHAMLWGVRTPAGYYTQDARTHGVIATTAKEPRIVRDFVLRSGSPWHVEVQGARLAAGREIDFGAFSDPDRQLFTVGERIGAHADARGKAVLTIPFTGGYYRFVCVLPTTPSRYEVPAANLHIDKDFDPRHVKLNTRLLSEPGAVRLTDVAGRTALVEGVPVLLEAGRAVLRFQARPMATASALILLGAVVDEHGKPVAGAKCTAAFAKGNSAAMSELEGTTNAEGRFEMRDVRLTESFFGPDARISMIVVKSGFNGAQTTELNLSDVQKAGRGDFGPVVLKPGRTLHGKVVDEDGRPLQGAVVTNMTNYFLYYNLVCRTDAEGQFTMRDLSYGNQKITAQFGQRWGEAEVQFDAANGSCVITARPVVRSGIRRRAPAQPPATPALAPRAPAKISWDLAPPIKEPHYRQTPRYALLVFGPKQEQRVWLVLDGTTLYVDRKASGDLTEPANRLEPNNPTDGGNRFAEGSSHAHFDVFEFTVRAGGTGTSKFRLDHWIRAAKFKPSSEFDRKEHEDWLKQGYENATLWRRDGRGQGQTPVLFMPKPADAQVCAFDGPLTFAVKMPDEQVLQRGEGGCQVSFHIVGSGRSPAGTKAPLFNRLSTGEVPKNAHLAVTVDYPSKLAGAPPLRRKYLLKERC